MSPSMDQMLIGWENLLYSSIFPNLTYSDAKALVWDGLQETGAWLNDKQTHAAEVNNILLRADQSDKKHTLPIRMAVGPTNFNNNKHAHNFFSNFICSVSS